MWLIVVLALAVYRVAHFAIDDGLIATPRLVAFGDPQQRPRVAGQAA